MRVCLSLIPSLSLPLPSLSYLRPLSLPFGVEGDATAHTHTHTHTHTGLQGKEREHDEGGERRTHGA